MEARALTRIMSIPKGDRIPVIAEGLALLIEHVERLRGDAEHLAAAKRWRAANVVTALAEEEAAKVLILLDAVRLGWRDEKVASRHLKTFSNHLARCIYVEITDSSPADLAEVRRFVNDYRQSHYLDGPNDVDWIFRNQLEAKREEILYVDYVQTDDGPHWVTPAYHEDFWRIGRVVELALALGRSGLTSAAGLSLVSNEWVGVEIEDKTHWQRIRHRSFKLLQAAEAAGLLSEAFTEPDISTIVETWGFPLGHLDLTAIKVKEEDLRSDQRRHLEPLESEWYGE
jgi:AbiV family abortive infection protein